MAEQETVDATKTEPVQGQTVRVGDTWEDMDPREDENGGPRRRVGVLEVAGGRAHVENKVSRVKSHISLERFCPPHWRFIG